MASAPKPTHFVYECRTCKKRITQPILPVAEETPIPTCCQGSGLSGMWERVDCHRCQALKEKIIDTAATEERAIVEQMGDMAAFMRAEDGKQEVTP